MRSQCAIWLCVVGVAASVAVAPAWGAAPALSVVRGTGAGADKAAAFVGYYVGEQMAQDPRFTLVDMDTVMGSTRSEQALREFAAAEALSEQGKAAYESLDLDLAVQYFEQAIEKYRSQIAYLAKVEPVAKIMMLLGATHILRGEEQIGIERLTQALRISPSIEPDPRIFNPAMRKIFDGVAESMATQAVSSLVINSSPSNGQVFVDGVFRGITPLTLDGVGVGEHWIRIVKEGYHSMGGVQNVVVQSDNTYVATMRPERIADQYESLAQEVAVHAQKSPKKVSSEMLEIAGLAHATYVMVVAVQLDGDRVQLNASLFDAAQKKHVASGSNVLSYSTEGDVYRREVRDLFQRSFGDKANLAQEGVATPSAEDAGKSPFVSTQFAATECNKWWQLCHTKNKVALGLGVTSLAVMGAGAGMWVLAGQKNDEFPKKEQISTDASSLKASGKTYALTGDILIITGGAMAVGALIAFFVPAKKAYDDDSTATVRHGHKMASIDQRTWTQRLWSDMHWVAGPHNGGAMIMTTMHY